jgi:quinoprotein glucose dehydrogenase
MGRLRARWRLWRWRGPWNDERLWLPHFDGQAAYIVPPVANVANGPSGIAIDPGTGISRAFAGRLFLCDFTGSEQSGVRVLTVELDNFAQDLVSKMENEFLKDDARE